MERDLEMEQRVWERVKGEAAPDLRGMELRCRESAAAFRQLAAQTRGSIRDALTELNRAEQENAETLRGMRILSGEEPEPHHSYEASQISLQRGLAQSLHRSRESWTAYTAHTRRTDYGTIFTRLSQKETHTMQTILSLIGKTR